ncbi:MAG TPA: alkaline phosphatase family protein [Candidatus Cybelea sp.]|jgi:phospholipase C|nr:alkaline phosphatase family protein [Candidatus Cybelea sp.]
MKKVLALKVLALIAGVAVAGCGGTNGISVLAPVGLLPQSGSSHSPIQHVVIVIQENRSFDNLFDCFKGTACVTYGKERVMKNGRWIDKRVTLTEQDLVPKEHNTDIGHCYYSFSRAYDQGKMDGFNREPYGVCPRNWPKNVHQIDALAYTYVNPAEIAPYWGLASQYVLGDRMFQTQGSGSFTAHQDLIRGGTALSGPYGSSSSLIDTPDGDPWGCDAPSNVVTDLISTSLVWGENDGPLPCSKDFPGSGYTNYHTMRDLLDAAGVSWKYYSPCFKDSGTSSCQGQTCTTCIGALLNAFDVIGPVRYGPEWGTNVSMPQTNILTDIQDNALPAVSWLIPAENDSDHPGDPVDNGPQWVASVVNAIGESSYWDSSAIVVLWDDWGGLYDHVKPPGKRDDQGGLGFRVPLIIISPYVKQGAVSHTQYEFGSILKYVEQNWKLGSLGTTDKRANSILNVFHYKQQPRAFSSIPSSKDANYFLHEPPSGPGDPE